MKRYIVLLAVMLIGCVCVSTMTAGDKKKGETPSITFKKKSYDFGTIKENDGKVTCEFAFTNKGDAPLIIISATAGCGCTTPEYSEEPIAPGKSSAIKVTYNPKGRPGEFRKNVTVRTNDPKNRKVTLQISGTVVPQAQ